MSYETFLSQITSPYWCKGSPLAWTTEDSVVGLAGMAVSGQVGYFNLCWWMLQRNEPPPADVYRNTDMTWVMQVAPAVFIDGRSMIEHASTKTLTEFNKMILAHAGNYVWVDTTGGVPWALLTRLARKYLNDPVPD